MKQFLLVAVFFILSISLIAATAQAEEANSTSYRIVSQVFDAGGGTVNSSYVLTTSFTDMTGMSKYKNTIACIGYLCFSLQQVREQKFITVVMNFNISGKEGDSAYVDSKGFGFYLPVELNKYYTCVEDASIQGTPTFGIVFAGNQLNYIRMLNYSDSADLRVSQFEEGNRFLLPVTKGGCQIIANKLPMSSLAPFVPASTLADSIEFILSYPFMNIIGDFQRSGKLSLVLEKNGTNQILVDVI
jgi:hypothetical protein